MSPTCWWAVASRRLGWACWICWADWAYLEVKCAWKGWWCSKDWEGEVVDCHQNRTKERKWKMFPKTNREERERESGERERTRSRKLREKKAPISFVVKNNHHHHHNCWLVCFLLPIWYCGDGCLPALCQPLEQFWAPDEFIQCGNDRGEGRPMSSFLLPTIQHEIVNGFRAVHWSRQSTINRSLLKTSPCQFKTISNKAEKKWNSTYNPFQSI